MSSNETIAPSLPTGWTLTTIADIAELRAGYGFPTSLQGKRVGRFPFYKVGDISSAWKKGSSALLEAEHFVDEEDLKQLRAIPLPSGATVFAKIGAAIGLNRRAMVDRPSLVDNNVFGLIPAATLVHPRYLFYFTWTLKLGDVARATTVPSLRKQDVENVGFPLPPRAEQERIVSALEQRLSQVAASVAALTRVRANLKRYRASVLKAACEGRLVATEAELARQEGREYESADMLLSRVRRESNQIVREAVEFNEKVRLPLLPDGWIWAQLPELITSLRNGISAKPTGTAGIPILRISAVRPLAVDLQDIRFLAGAVAEFSSFALKEGDLLFTRYNGNTSYVGVCGVVPAVRRMVVYPDKLIRAEVDEQVADSRFLQVVINSGASRSHVERRTKTTAGQAGISGGDLKQTPVPLAPLAEQKRIASEVERRLSTLDKLEAEVANGLRRAERLRQSILKRAFDGKLVPQDPNDEPASVLLERIRAARAAQAPIPRKRRAAAK